MLHFQRSPCFLFDCLFLDISISISRGWYIWKDDILCVKYWMIDMLEVVLWTENDLPKVIQSCWYQTYKENLAVFFVSESMFGALNTQNIFFFTIWYVCCFAAHHRVCVHDYWDTTRIIHVAYYSQITRVMFSIIVQYIPRNMHTVLLCFALLWLCNHS